METHQTNLKVSILEQAKFNFLLWSIIGHHRMYKMNIHIK